MDVNFFGLMAVTRKAMQVMREKKTGGVIQQVTSIGGQRGVPLFSVCELSSIPSGSTPWCDRSHLTRQVLLRWGVVTGLLPLRPANI